MFHIRRVRFVSPIRVPEHYNYLHHKRVSISKPAYLTGVLTGVWVFFIACKNFLAEQLEVEFNRVSI